MNVFKIVGKYLDQPLLVAKFEKKVPLILTVGGSVCVANAVKKSPNCEKDETLLRVGTTMLFTLLSALLAPRFVNKLFKKEMASIKDIKLKNSELIDKFIKEKNPDKNLAEILNKSKNKVLTLKETKFLCEKFEKDKSFLNKLIPEPDNITSKEIFSEIGRLSLLGLIPVIGGIAGGIAGDLVVSKNWKENVPNKIKEGTYQYLANIFLCNVGAGIALGIMEKLGVKTKASRALGMVTGILLTGVIGGSAIANLIGNKIINPIFGNSKNKGLFSERKPEALDIGLHVDDIATVAVMSGLKWIEPVLPIMYAISGYRAGIGYRNVLNDKKYKNEHCAKNRKQGEW